VRAPLCRYAYILTAGNEYSNDALVDLFLSSLRTDNTAYYSILHTTLENQRTDGKKIPFVDMELEFIQLEECYTSNGSSHRERANRAALFCCKISIISGEAIDDVYANSQASKKIR
jgi:hypothetical protein